MEKKIKNPKAPPSGVRSFVSNPAKSPAAVKMAPMETPAAKKNAAVKASKTPKYKEKMLLEPEVEALGLDNRPMIWRDLAEFSARHGRTIADMVYDMVLLTNHAYSTKTPLRTVVPFDLEFLTRLYDLYPSSCAWKRPSIRDMFELMYAGHLKSFDADSEPVARLAVGRRYAKMLGRVDTAQYRWLSEDGKITRRLGNILSKVEESALTGEHPLDVFERVGKRIWELRGFDIDKHFPLPTKENVLKPPGTRGRLMSVQKKVRSIHQPVYSGGSFA